jgi:uncharacterized membrane protein
MTDPSAPPPAPPAASGTVSPNRTVMIVLAYLWILALVPLLVEKEDREVQWHAKHGLVLLVAEIVCWIAVTIITTMLGQVASGLGCLLSMATPFLGLAFLVLRVLCIVKGINGQRFIIPGLSQYADRF